MATQNRDTREPRKSRLGFKLALALASSLLMVFLGELGLRLLGFHVGYQDSFTIVDRLEVFPSFFTDEEGVFKANPHYDWPSDYTINSDGFRSTEFVYHDHSRPKVLFLGDSFTWGASAHPITNSFVDRVAMEGYLVYNTGIPGTDPRQYAYLAEKYVPLLRPDIVAVMLCMANDLREPTPMIPNENLYHVTNAGWLYAFDADGRYMTPERAYEYYARIEKNIFFAISQGRSLKGRIRPMFLRSALGSQAWFAAQRAQSLVLSYGGGERENPARSFLDRIRDVSNQSGARFLLFLVPDHPNNAPTNIMRQLAMFEGLDPRYSDALDVDDYALLPDGHFNNSGHRKYAEFVLRNIRSSPKASE